MEEAWQFAMTYLIFFRILTSQDTTNTPASARDGTDNLTHARPALTTEPG